MLQVFDHSFYTAYSPCKTVKIVLYFCPNQGFMDVLISDLRNTLCSVYDGSLLLMPVLTFNIKAIVLVISYCNGVSNEIAKFDGGETIIE